MAPRYTNEERSIIEGALGLGFPAGSGVPASVRAKVGFARTPEGGMNILTAEGYVPVDLSLYGHGEGELGVYQGGRV